MSEIDISSLDLHDQFGSGHITARDLDFYSLLRRHGEDGSLYFNRQRAILFESDAIGNLRQQLISYMGLRQALEILFRFGYAQGDKDARVLGNNVNWASDADWLAAGTILPMLSGMAKVDTHVLEYNREAGQFYMKGFWHNSYEASEYLKHFGTGDQPVCSALVGYVSAYSSRFFGRDLLAIETECVAKGDHHCAWEVKPVEEWGTEARPWLNALHSAGQADQFSQAQANFIIENSPVVIFRWRAIEGYPVEYVSANIEQFGYTPQELVSGDRPYPSLVHPDDLQRALEEIQYNAEQGNDSFVVEYRLVTKKGEIRWVDTKLTFERDAAGQISHFLGVLSDITDRKRTEEEMQRLSLAVEQSANTVVITDTDGYIEYANPKFEEITGYSLSEAIGQHTRILKSGETSADEYRLMWKTISAGQQWRGEFHNRRKNGDLYWESAVISPIKNSAGEITNYLAIKEDISRQKLAQEALTRRAVELETVAQVSVAAATIFDPERLLQDVADLTKERFHLYHAHIYLLNPRGDTLELAAGAGTVGRAMVTQGWRIALTNTESIVAQAAQTRAGIIENDVTRSDRHLPNPMLPETRSELAVPLIVGDEVLGVLDVQADTPHYFSQDDIRIQTTLAAQVAVAIQNARLFQQTQAALARTEALNQVIRSVVASETLPELIQTAAESIARTLVADRALLLALDEESAQIIGFAYSGPGADRVPPPRLKTLFEELFRGQSGRAMRERKAVVVSGGISEPRADVDAYWLRDVNDIGAMVVTPIYYRDKALGTIITTNRVDQPAFSRDDVEFLENLANQLASILENRVLLERMQGALAGLEATQRRYTVQAWDSYLTQTQTRKYERTSEVEAVSPDSMLPELEMVLDSGQSIVVSAETPPDQTKPSKLLVPLKIRDQVIGVLGLQEAESARPWTPEEIALVEAVAEQMAQAAENLRLLDETQQRAAREGRVNEIGAKIRAAHSLEEALQIAVREVGLSLSAPQTSVQLKVVE